MVPALFRFSHDLSDAEPELCESVEFTDDFTVCRIKIREGIKWSDGEPFTADDIVFFFDDWQFDQDISPVVSQQWVQGGEVMRVEKVDDFTVQFEFEAPNPAFTLLHYSAPPHEPYVPMHFMKQFHPRYAEDAVERAENEGFENWQDQFLLYADIHYGEQPPERPVLDPWMPVENDQHRQRYERNPYYWKVDPEGRQLPYIDEVVVEYVNDLQVMALKAQGGELDIGGRDLAVGDYPNLKNGESNGGYRATLFSSERGSEVAIAFNQEHKDPDLRELFRDVRFRRAMSMAINRDEINRIVFLDQGVARQATVNESASYFQDDWATAHAQFDPDTAEALLDEIGLGRGDDGARILPDGRNLAFEVEYVAAQGPKADAVELVVRHWEAVGVEATSTPRDQSYLGTRLDAAEHDVSVWHVDRQLERSAWVYGAYSSKLRPGGDSSIRYAADWRAWFNSGGADGVEPPDEAKELESAFDEWSTHEYGSEEYERAAQRVHDLVSQSIWVIGVIGQGPAPVVVSEDLENVLTNDVYEGNERVWFGAANWYWLPHRAEQWFFATND